LIKANNQIIFAGNEDQINIVKNDFPNLCFEFLEGYNVKLDSTKSTYIQLFKQSRRINRIIRSERSKASQLAARHKVDIILSDNRYGFYSDMTLNVFLTHQLSPPVPYFKKLVKKKIATWVNKFNLCWIIDDKHQPICKDLNQNKLDIPIYHIGWLSRFKGKDETIKYEYLVIASGAQPERNRFKRELIFLLNNTVHSFAVVDNFNDLDEAENYFINPSTEMLEKLINSSRTVITRCGYTSIMELAHMKKKAILVPTKGQYEQEYLAKHLDLGFLKVHSFEEIKHRLI
jgi:uncharacterized protein (TIGR00661 family)